MPDESVLFESIIQHRSEGASDVLGDASKIEGVLDRLNQGADIDLNLSNKSILSDLEALDSATLTPVIDATFEDRALLTDLTALDSATLTPNIDATFEDRALLSDLNALDSATLTPVIDTQETPSGDAVLDRLDMIRNLQAIEIVMNVAGNIQTFTEKFGQIGGFAGVLEMDSAMSRIEATTGRIIPGAERLINDLYIQGWGESRTAIGEVITAADNLGFKQSELESATRGALQIQQIYGIDTEETLRTVSTLLATGLAPNADSAFDLIVTGLQDGNNKAGDWLETLNEYGGTFDKMRISGPGALTLVNTMLDNGIVSGDKAADAVRELGINLGNINTDPNIQNAFIRLDGLSDIDLKGLLRAYQQGEISGDDFFAGFFAALSEASTKDPAKAQQIASQLIGPVATEGGVQLFSGVTTKWDESMVAIEGRATTAGTTVRNNLNDQLEELWRTIEVKAQEFLSSDQIGLPAKIDEIKTGVREAIDVLQSGGTLGEALEIGFRIQGVDEFMLNFQRVVGNFTIELLKMIASLQEFLPGGSTGEATRAEISRLAKGQLAFDLKVANADEMAGIVQTAIDRGVDQSQILSVLETTFFELIDEEDVTQARLLADEIARAADTAGLAGIVDTGAYQQIANEAASKLTGQAYAAFDAKDFNLAEALFKRAGDDQSAQWMRDTVDLWEQDFATAMSEGNFDAAGKLAEQLGDSEKMTAVQEAMAAVEEAQKSLSSVILTETEAMNTAIAEFGQYTGNVLTGNTVTEDFQAVAMAAEDAFPRTTYQSRQAQAAVEQWAGVGTILDIVSGKFWAFVTSAQAAALAASAAATSIAGALAEISANQGKINEAQAAANVPAKAGGGLAEGWFTAGERGTELLFADETMAVLNNRTTEAFFAGQRSLAAALYGTNVGGVGAVNSSRNVNMQNVYYVQSEAQAMSVSQQTANKLRGY